MLGKYGAIAIVLVALASLLFGAGVYVGRAGLQKQIAKAQTKQLEKDAKESVKIEERSDEREENTKREVEEVHAVEPDWATRRLPDNVIERLRKRGLSERSPAS